MGQVSLPLAPTGSCSRFRCVSLKSPPTPSGFAQVRGGSDLPERQPAA